jgi:lipopolysaccharide transport system ATP-binding protein
MRKQVVHNPSLEDAGPAGSPNGSVPSEVAPTEGLPSLDTAQAPGQIVRSTETKVIKFSHVSKRFILHHERPRSFQEIVVSLFGLRTPSKRGMALPRPTKEEFWALRDVNFSIYRGEAVGIIGENGSGKSTTLKLISRILEPTSGSVSVRGKVSALLELGAGFHPDLTGRENIFLHGALLGLPQKEIEARYEDIVDFAELREFIDTPIKHYSSGMVMRLGFAVAINVDPDILLTDEVLAVGDEAFQRKCLDYIAGLRRRGVTIVFVSHALEAVRALCERAIWLHHGQVMADGPSGEVVDKYLAFENEKHWERLRAEQHAQHDQRATRVTMTTATGKTPALAHADTDQATAGEPEAPQGVPVESRAKGELEISGVQFLNGEGMESEVFLTGKPLTIRIKYEAHKRVHNPVFGLAIYTENGTHLNGPNTRFGGLDIPYVEGRGCVDYHVERLPLLAGRYEVTVAATGPDMAHIYDHQHRAYSFVVQPTPGVPERWGIIHIPATWSHARAEDPLG